jgi:hypothetical protein
MAQIGEYYYENLTPEKIDKIVDIFSKPESNPDLKYEI